MRVSPRAQLRHAIKSEAEQRIRGPELNNQRVGALVWETSRIDVLVEEGDE